MKNTTKCGDIFCLITSGLLIVLGFVMFFITLPVTTDIPFTICADIIGCILGGITARLFVNSVNSIKGKSNSFYFLDAFILVATFVFFLLFGSSSFAKRVCFIFPMASFTSICVELYNRCREMFDEKIVKKPKDVSNV